MPLQEHRSGLRLDHSVETQQWPLHLLCASSCKAERADLLVHDLDWAWRNLQQMAADNLSLPAGANSIATV